MLTLHNIPRNWYSRDLKDSFNYHQPCQNSIMSDELETYETNTLAFRIKIWVEERADGKTKAKWRGYIVHVPTKEKEHYVSDFFEIDLYILSYLIKIGFRASWFWRLVSWYKSKQHHQSNPQNAGKEKI